MFERLFEDRDAMERAWVGQQAQVPFEYPQLFRDGVAGPKGFELRDFAKEITDPTFILEGSSRRPRVGIQRLVSTLKERLGEDLTYETVPGGHYLQLDRPETVNDRLQRFLNANART